MGGAFLKRGENVKESGRGEIMTIVEDELLAYREAKREVEIYTTELESLEQLTMVKVTNYSAQVGGGNGLDQEERYWKWMSEKDEVKLKLAIARRVTSRIDKALDLLYSTHPHECNAVLLYYVKNKGINYISNQIGYSRNITKNKIKLGVAEFEKILKIGKKDK